jgi:hypothetical protein
MEDITPSGSAAPVYRAEVDEAQRAADQAEAARIADEQAAALETRKAPLRRLGLTEDEINTVLGI